MQGIVSNTFKKMEIIGKRLLLYFQEELWLKGIGIEETRSYSEKELSLVELVNRAHREWEQSKILFNEAQDPLLIDHAIYAMEAAEKKYIYLLEKARKENIVDKSINKPQDIGLA